MAAANAATRTSGAMSGLTAAEANAFVAAVETAALKAAEARATSSTAAAAAETPAAASPSSPPPLPPPTSTNKKPRKPNEPARDPGLMPFVDLHDSESDAGESPTERAVDPLPQADDAELLDAAAAADDDRPLPRTHREPTVGYASTGLGMELTGVALSDVEESDGDGDADAATFNDDGTVRESLGDATRKSQLMVDPTMLEGEALRKLVARAKAELIGEVLRGRDAERDADGGSGDDDDVGDLGDDVDAETRVVLGKDALLREAVKRGLDPMYPVIDHVAAEEEEEESLDGDEDIIRKYAVGEGDEGGGLSSSARLAELEDWEERADKEEARAAAVAAGEEVPVEVFHGKSFASVAETAPAAEAPAPAASVDVADVKLKDPETRWHAAGAVAEVVTSARGGGGGEDGGDAEEVAAEVAAEEDAPSKPKTAAELRAAKKAKKKAKKEKKGKALRETMAAREDDDD